MEPRELEPMEAVEAVAALVVGLAVKLVILVASVAHMAAVVAVVAIPVVLLGALVSVAVLGQSESFGLVIRAPFHQLVLVHLNFWNKHEPLH
jgi:hypothetical protein